MALTKPRLFTFDIFGTVLDWRTGLDQSLGRALTSAEFDAVVDRQAELERTFAPYAEIVLRSLREVLGVDETRARPIGDAVGRWPLFVDSRDAMRRLRKIAPCVAATNSDVAHGVDVRAQLGEMDAWLCAGELRVYKPDRRVWEATAQATRTSFGPAWWHVSAYADYDLATARELGLTCVFVRRPHHRAGTHDVAVDDLAELAALAERL
jgi:2-haloalkanoic acid dehalogenase type II